MVTDYWFLTLHGCKFAKPIERRKVKVAGMVIIIHNIHVLRLCAYTG